MNEHQLLPEPLSGGIPVASQYMGRGTLLVWIVSALAIVASACTATPQPPNVGIKFDGSRTVDGWRYDAYINYDAPCSESGHQTFVLATREGAISTDRAPLWTFLHGGGAGYYTEDGVPMPNDGNKREEKPQALADKLVGGLIGPAKSSPKGFRFLAVSMCSHDTYAGNNTPDPGNDTPTTGLAHTVAAINWVKANYATSDVVLHGGSAGSIGAFHVGYWMQITGQAPAAIVADSAVLNSAWWDAQVAIGQTLPDGSENACYRSVEEQAAIQARWDGLFQGEQDQTHLRIETGQLTVPVMHIWSTNDFNQCGSRPMSCPLPDGSIVTMGSAQCNNLPTHEAIEALPSSNPSVDMEVCVNKGGAKYPEDCDWHVPTQTDGENTYASVGDPARDYNGVILNWVEERVSS